MTAFPRFARLFVFTALVLFGFAFVRLTDWRGSFLIDILTLSGLVAGGVVALFGTPTIERRSGAEGMNSPPPSRADQPDNLVAGAFWVWYDRLSYRLLFPLAAVLCAVILRCAADYLITGHAVVHKIHEYDAHRVLYPQSWLAPRLLDSGGLCGRANCGSGGHSGSRIASIVAER